jgi:hypothetical protein
MIGGAMTRSSLVLLVACLLAFGVAVAPYAMTVLAHPHDLWAMSDLKVYRWGGLLAALRPPVRPDDRRLRVHLRADWP